jgi:hypothetical protein
MLATRRPGAHKQSEGFTFSSLAMPPDHTLEIFPARRLLTDSSSGLVVSQSDTLVWHTACEPRPQ